jgi:hypothetical protein
MNSMLGALLHGYEFPLDILSYRIRYSIIAMITRCPVSLSFSTVALAV